MRRTLWASLALLGACQSGGLDSQPMTVPVVDPAPLTRTVPDIVPEVSYRLKPDLWRDIRQRFELAHRVDERRVQQELRWLEEHPRYLPNLQPRLERFLAYIHQEVAVRELPAELALLPIIESAMDPYAFSHGGAAGLWQFIPATAKRFGLRRDWWYDGRRDPLAATQAALDYLEYLYALFDDWELAVAAYNAGEGHVRRAQKRAAPGATFWEMRLPRETSAYVPRLLALATLINDPQAYGVDLPALSPVVPFVTLDTHGQFDLMKAAECLETDVDTIYGWNPAFNRWSTPPHGPHRLLVPDELAAGGQARISAVPESERVHWLRVKVANGDTLSQLAQRHGTDTASLRKANGLTGSRIRAGQSLYIPKSSRALSDYPHTRQISGTHYFVKPGDSLWTISRAHGVPMERIIKANQVGPKEVLHVGQRLVIPGASRPSERRVVRRVHYGVRKGDSLARIADRFNVRVSQIVSWNRLNVNNYLQPGQSLTLFVNVAAGE